MKKCGCKRNLLGVCSCKRVSRGRKTRRALTDEPYERSIRPRYAVPRSRRPEYNFPAIDPKRPGQILRPGVPSTSTGFTAPSPFSRGATSAFDPVLRAASNYINEITKTARLQNQMTMANMGGGGSAGSGSNITVNGSVDSRNTNRVLSANPNSAPLNENVNSINSDGTYQSFRNNVINVNQDEFESNAEFFLNNINKDSSQGPANNINYQPQIDQTNEDNESVQVLADEDRDILANNQKQNENLDNLINQELQQQPQLEDDDLYENDIWLYRQIRDADEPLQINFLRKLRQKGELDVFEKGYRVWEKMGSPEPNMTQVEPSFIQDYKNFVREFMPSSTLPPNVQPPTPLSKPSSTSSNFGPNDSGVTSSSGGSTMYSPVSNSQNMSSSNIGSKPGKQQLRRLQSPLGEQDRQRLEQLKKNKESPVSSNTNTTSGSETESDLNTSEQMEPSEFTEGSIPVSSVSSKETRQSAVAARARAQDVFNANKRNKVLVAGGGGNKEIPAIRANIYQDDPDVQNIRTEEDAIRAARMLAGQGFKSQAAQEEMQQLARNQISVENVFTPSVRRKP
jgi:hypothetical protein